MSKAIQDTLTMSKRCLRLSFRNPEAFAGVIVTPILFVLLFVYLFGSSADDQQSFVNAQVPSIMIATLGVSTFFTAYNVNSDMKNGIIDRFRSMPLFQPSFLMGHVITSLVRTLIASIAVIVTSFMVGFQPQGSAAHWLGLIGILFGTTLFFTWIAIFVGLISESAENVSSYALIVQFFPFLSGGFAEPDNLVAPLRIFFGYQPFTPIINSVRGLSMGVANRSNIISTVIWCLILSVVFYTLSIRDYKRKVG